MDLNKNTDLVLKVCNLQIKSIDQVVDIPVLNPVYFTPSKITLSQSSQFTESGVLHRKRITLTYPGLSTLDFDNLSSILRGTFQVFFKLDNNDVFEFTAENFPAVVSTTYNISSGHQLTFTSNSMFPPKFRENQPADGIAIDGFNYDFNFYLS